MGEMTEGDAVARLRSGDIDGLEVLVRQHYATAVRAAYLIVRDHALAEDIVQDAFVAAYEHIQQFDPSRPFAPWFLRSVVNRAITASQRAARLCSLDTDAEARTLADLLPSNAVPPDTQVEQAEVRDVVWAALERLPPKQRAAAVLRYYLGLSEADLAATLQIPVGTVKWRLYAARARLQTQLRRWVTEATE